MPFQIGDRVRVVRTTEYYSDRGLVEGAIVTITSLSAFGIASVATDDGRISEVFLWRVEPLEVPVEDDNTEGPIPPVIPTRPLQRGDRVRFVNDEDDWTRGRGLVLGNIYTVHRVYTRTPMIELEELTTLNYDNRPSIYASHFELVTEENEAMPNTTQDLLVGDIVRLTGGTFGSHVRNSLARIATAINRYYLAEVMQGEEGEGHTQYFHDLSDVEIVEQIRVGDTVFLTNPDASRNNRVQDAHVVQGEAYEVTQRTVLSDRQQHIKVRGGDSHHRWINIECFSKENVVQPDPIKKFWMVIRDDARQTQKRHYNYDDAVAESKRLSTENPDNSFIILEALITVKSNGSTHTAEILED